ncbi:hypothetical protein V502_01973 [Pseudogymnoascus sp. VKM F-4520 (FW-2644)]|nr:hypothetical protein V502_01973 [Pseudogymnoascus sp. VKM F-4520 (FW-2644)]
MLNLPEIDTRLVRLFYENFHAAHPILLPSSLYEERAYPGYLQQVIKFIGSHYSQRITGDILRQATADQLHASKRRDPSMVQALLLYSIILFARGESAEAQAALSQSMDIALELGMYLRDSATSFSKGNEMEAESLRRTWWELFIVDVDAAALQNQIILRSHGVPYDVVLPCEESTYAARGPLPPPSTLAALHQRVYCDEDEDKFSSFSYRIEAVRILARVLVLNDMAEPQRDHLQAVENALISWVNHLPPNKVDVVDAYGTVDEMLLQAHTTIHYAAMLLHLPRSNLRPVAPDLSMGIYPATQLRLSPTFTRHVHSIKATEASKQLSDLLSVRPSVQRYSPFIIFKLVLCAVIQLATGQMHSAACSEHHSNRIVLVLGCLKMLRRHWPIAQRAHQYLCCFASETFSQWMESTNPGTGSTSTSSSGGGSSLPVTAHSSESEDWPSGSATGVALPTSEQVPGFFSPGLLSAYIDPTCGDSFLVDTGSEFDFI